MLAFRTHSTLFTHVIAAASAVEAERVAISVTARPFAIVEQWHTPDIWTRRAVDVALAPGIIDTIPRFVVDRKDGPVYLDIEDVPSKLSSDERGKILFDGPIHHAWMAVLEAAHAAGVHRNHDYVTKTVAAIATQSDDEHHSRYTRALAGAWGLGPIPEWHAAILPALIALDIETTGTINAFSDNVFELDIVELCYELKRCYDLSARVPSWCKEALRQTLNCLSGQSTSAQIRATSLDVLRLVDWIR